MEAALKPIKTDSLVDIFISRFEDLILSGHFKIGEKLPPERELALKLGVSRPVVHEGMVYLASKGLVTLKPRVGTIVNDYRNSGSLALLNSLVNYHMGMLDQPLLEGLLEMRKLFETETARLAAIKRKKEHLALFREILAREASTDKGDTASITEMDFAFHHALALASGNVIYPMLINSFREVYTSLTGIFFSDIELVRKVFGFHADLFGAVEKKDAGAAVKTMGMILDHGEAQLKKILKK